MRRAGCCGQLGSGRAPPDEGQVAVEEQRREGEDALVASVDLVDEDPLAVL